MEALKVECPTCSAAVGKQCQSLFTDWDESIPHATRVEVAGRVAPERDTEPPRFPHLPPLDTDPPSPPRLPHMDEGEDLTAGRPPYGVDSFSCGPCGAPEEYRALGNRAKHAHLCGDCWLDCTDPQRECYERVAQYAAFPQRGPKHDPQTGRPRPRIMQRSTEVMGFQTLQIAPGSVAMTQVLPQWAVKPTHLYILVRAGERLQISHLRVGYYEHLTQPVPAELFRPLSDELVAALSEKHRGDEDVFLAALGQHCRIDMGTTQIGNAITLGVRNPGDEPAVVDAAIKVYSNREVH
jgi:hypothetical protein